MRNKKKIIFSLIAVIILVGGLITGLLLMRQRQILKSKAAPATTLQLVAPTLSVTTGNDFVVNVNINTAENLVAGVEMKIKYDPTKLKAENVNLGSFLSTADTVGPFIDSAAGTINYTLINSPGTPAKQGTGTVASINFNALATGNTVVSFIRDETIVVAIQEGGQNVLTTASAANITVQGGASSPSPSPTITPDVGGSDVDVFWTPTPTATPTETLPPDDNEDDTDEEYDTPSPSPTSTATSSPKATSSPQTYSLPTSTVPPNTPETGVSWPLVLGACVGLLLIVGSLLLVI